jgi:replicative DNA helicase
MTHEETLIGQILRDPRIFSSLSVTKDHFSTFKCRKTFDRMSELASDGLDINLITLNALDQGIDMGWLSTVETNTPTAANWEWVENKVVEGYKLRVLRSHATYLSECTLQDGVVETERILELLTAVSQSDKMEHRKDLLPDWLEEFEQRYKNKGQLPGLTTGFPSLDAKTLGWQRGMFYVVAARPSRGKTAIGLNFLDNLTMDHRVPAGWLDVENSYRQIITRSFSSDTGIKGKDLRTGRIKREDFPRIQDSGTRMKDSPCWIYCSPNQSIDRICSVGRAMVRQKGAKILFVDYLQKINGKGSDRTESASNSSLALKALATSLDVPVVALAQLSREAEDTRPRMNMLQWASQIEQDADGIIFLHPTGKEDIVELIVEKDREGEAGSVFLKFKKEVVKFEELNEDVY